ncbi:hypothetical protein [Halosimplex amylolyticum]|uniref:hypothetical protein n=1 Tax=Halosimplex amylolyticum TaxID=3396616 RepID=UPI003F573941
MEHVIEVEDGDAAVLREAGSGGLIARGLLADRPLAEYVRAAETPRYVVRNKKRGVSIERTDEGDATEARDAQGEVVPDGDHSAAALVTDVRVLFAVGRADGDRTRSVALSDVVDARAEGGLLGGALVIDTVDGRQYRFPTRGDLDAVREFVDAAAGVWARAERHLETAAEALDRAEARSGSDDAADVLAALDDAREALEAAREAAASLDGAAASIADRVGSSRKRLRRHERRAYAERAERVAERAQALREDGDYESALDLLERADDSYAAALSVDADRPTDDAIERRRERVATERDQVTTVPLERAEAAVEKASAAEDPEAAVEWWERALERYETLLALDWGRDERRFAGERDVVRERLATAAEQLVAAHCDRARAAIDLVEEWPPGATDAADERAASALDAARDVARERVPDELDTVERLRDRLAERRSPRPGEEFDEPGDAAEAPEDVDAGDTVVIAPEDDEESPADGDDPAPADGDDPAPADGDGPAPADSDDVAPGDGDDPAPADGDDPAPADEAASVDRSDDPAAADSDDVAPGDGDDVPTEVDEEIAEALAEAMAGDVDEEIAEAVDETIVDADAEEPDAATPDEPDTDEEGWIFVDDETDDDWVSAERTEPSDGDSAESVGDPADGIDDPAESVNDPAESIDDSAESVGDSSWGVADSQTRVEQSGSGAVDPEEPEGPTVDPSSVGAERFRTLVAKLFEATGWETKFSGETLVTYDLRATTPEPVAVTAAVLTVDASNAATVDPDDVDRFVSAVERDGDLDEAVVAAGATVPERVRERAAERGVRIVGPDALADLADGEDVSLPDDRPTES